jgi:two-component system, LytTR family, response regulator LytT
MQYRVAICDDMVFYIDEIKEYIEKYARENEKQIDIKVYLNGTDLLAEAINRKYDLIFLDIDMPSLNGIDTAKRLREFDEDVIIIFITSHDSYSYPASQVEAMGYIVKPINQEKLYRIVKKAFILIEGIQTEKQSEKRFIEVNVDYEKTALDIIKIVCMEKYRNQLIIHMDNGEKYICYETLKNMVTRVPRTIFCQVSSSLIVNLLYVKDVKAYMITLAIKNELKEYSITRANFIMVRNNYLTFLKRKKRK